jgi:hypothetical protein
MLGIVPIIGDLRSCLVATPSPRYGSPKIPGQSSLCHALDLIHPWLEIHMHAQTDRPLIQPSQRRMDAYRLDMGEWAHRCSSASTESADAVTGANPDRHSRSSFSFGWLLGKGPALGIPIADILPV